MKTIADEIKEKLEGTGVEETKEVESTPTPEQEKPDTGEKKYTLMGKTYTEEELTKIIALATQTKRTPAEEIPEEAAPPGSMKVGSCWVKMNQLGTNVQLHDVTPSEVLYLTADHHSSAGGSCIFDVRITGEVKRTPKEEVDRLKGKYPIKKVKQLFPGAIPQLPRTFREAVQAGLEANINTDKLIVQVGA